MLLFRSCLWMWMELVTWTVHTLCKGNQNMRFRFATVPPRRIEHAATSLSQLARQCCVGRLASSAEITAYDMPQSSKTRRRNCI